MTLLCPYVRVCVCVFFCKWAWISELLEPWKAAGSSVFLPLRAAAVSLSVGSKTDRPWLWLVHCITRDAPITISVPVTVPGLSTLLVLVEYMPIPHHRYQFYMYVFDSILKFLIKNLSHSIMCNDLIKHSVLVCTEMLSTCTLTPAINKWYRCIPNIYTHTFCVLNKSHQTISREAIIQWGFKSNIHLPVG